MIAVIAVLTALLLPVFAAARERARAASCSSNQKQIGAALVMYTADYNDSLPSMGYNDKNGNHSWRQLIDAYARTRQLSTCPSNPVSGFPDSVSDGYSRSYACNYNRPTGSGGAGTCSSWNADGVRLSEIVSPSQVIAVTESTAAESDFDVLYPPGYAQPTDPTSPSVAAARAGNLFAGHGGRAEFLFNDGHVRSLKPLQTLSARDGGAGSVNLWTRDNSDFATTNTADSTAALKVLTFSQELYP